MSQHEAAFLALVLATFGVLVGSMVLASLRDIHHLPDNRDPERHHTHLH